MRFLTILARKGVVPEAKIDDYVAKAAELNIKTGELLQRFGMIDERVIMDVLSEQTGIPVYTEDIPLPETAIAPLNLMFLRSNALALFYHEEALNLALCDPFDYDARRQVAHAFPDQPVRLWLSTRDRIIDYLDRLDEQVGQGVEGMVEDIMDMDRLDVEVDTEKLLQFASEAPIVRFVNSTIRRAVEMGASDIHIEPFEKRLEVRFRVDGILQNMQSAPQNIHPAIVTRIKIMAKLDIGERRLAQDGRIKIRVAANDIDFRVSTIPTMYGESVVLRLLPKDNRSFDFASLGIAEHNVSLLKGIIRHPYGMFLISGPTGSGKTTTLYALLKQLNQPDKKIITIEDPIEYHVHGVNQIQVKPKIGLTFASGLRHIVRQDPDIILVGEIRDVETARIAIQSALTGHLVLSTVHTNNAVTAITRLLDMGIEDYLIASTIIGIAAQRLVRLLCNHCKQAKPAGAYAKEFPRHLSAADTIYRATGCPTCNDLGYSGRTAIMEVLPIDDGFRQMVHAGVTAAKLEENAVARGMRTMLEDGWQKIAAGATTIEEVTRVVS